ncbi:lipoate--protein ligase family protein [Bacillus xiapuensis]|uniref:lipoate--protein ligase family protein n=1 Tax=Bacillus xiapuensis TaxID=2014075 RepID=UPI000C2381FE|nr:biotin/lipoate A/B protein ligase family protein [Bacillus xiapuensis]
MKKEVWKFVDSGQRSASYNMAMDEALLDWHSEGVIPPVIRFYGWKPAALSIGYFQKAKKEINFEAVEKHGLGFVRRPTGGRGVLHEHELTYSVIVSENHPNMPAGVTDAYRVISEGILKGFHHLGLEAYFAVPKTESEKEHLKKPRSSVCFDAPSWYELVVEGRKIAGSAQTRQKGVILQHGSILLDLDEDKLFSLFNYPNERVKNRMRQAFRKKAVAINEISSKKITLDMARQAFKQGFEEGLSVELEPLELSDQQRDYIEKLAKERYESEGWNFKR